MKDLEHVRCRCCKDKIPNPCETHPHSYTLLKHNLCLQCREDLEDALSYVLNSLRRIYSEHGLLIT